MAQAYAMEGREHFFGVCEVQKPTDYTDFYLPESLPTIKNSGSLKYRPPPQASLTMLPPQNIHVLDY